MLSVGLWNFVKAAIRSVVLPSTREKWIPKTAFLFLQSGCSHLGCLVV